jgi:ATP-binding cassette subfamily B protein
MSTPFKQPAFEHLSLSKRIQKYIHSSDTLSLIACVAGENAKGHIGGYVLAGFCLVFIAAATAFSAWIMRMLVDEVFVEHKLDVAYAIAGAIFVVYLSRGLLPMFKTWC